MDDFFAFANGAIAILEPGAHPPLDLIPILKLMPERWAHWKTEVKAARQLHDKVFIPLLDMIERRLNQGDSIGCFIEAFVEKMQTTGMDRDNIL
jgi:hypothetical protein